MRLVRRVLVHFLVPPAAEQPPPSLQPQPQPGYIYFRQSRLRDAKLNSKITLVVIGLNQRFLTLFSARTFSSRQPGRPRRTRSSRRKSTRTSRAVAPSAVWGQCLRRSSTSRRRRMSRFVPPQSQGSARLASHARFYGLRLLFLNAPVPANGFSFGCPLFIF